VYFRLKIRLLGVSWGLEIYMQNLGQKQGFVNKKVFAGKFLSANNLGHKSMIPPKKKRPAPLLMHPNYYHELKPRGDN
jgi:hypothetical protein